MLVVLVGVFTRAAATADVSLPAAGLRSWLTVPQRLVVEANQAVSLIRVHPLLLLLQAITIYLNLLQPLELLRLSFTLGLGVGRYGSSVLL